MNYDRRYIKMLRVEVTKMTKNGYDWKKTLAKIGWSVAEVFVAGVIVVLTENPQWLAIVPALEGLRNYIKNK